MSRGTFTFEDNDKRALVNEALAALYWIAGALLFSIEWDFLAWICIVKGCGDTAEAIYLSLRKLKQ